nr:MAG TPA: hypothetical protein [Caudoviricetes sp.]
MGWLRSPNNLSHAWKFYVLLVILCLTKSPLNLLSVFNFPSHPKLVT